MRRRETRPRHYCNLECQMRFAASNRGRSGNQFRASPKTQLALSNTRAMNQGNERLQRTAQLLNIGKGKRGTGKRTTLSPLPFPLSPDLERNSIREKICVVIIPDRPRGSLPWNSSRGFGIGQTTEGKAQRQLL